VGRTPAPADSPGLAEAAAAGIHMLSIPTPFLVGRVNCWLIEDEPLTLVDTGPNSGKSLDVLERELGRLGHTIEDLGLVVITHQHMDHLGLLEIVVRRSGAEVAALDLLAPYLIDFGASAAADDAFAQTVMHRHGVPEDLGAVLGAVGAAFRAFGSSGRVTRPLHDGGWLELRDRRLQVAHRPGHSPTDTTFWDPERRILIAGDHLLAHISSNPLISRPPDGQPDRERPRALMAYLDSMAATRQLPAGLTLSGHGDPIADRVALIDERRRLHERRASKILGLIADAGEATAYEIATAMWGNVAVTQAYLTLSEVLGHLDLLAAAGEVVEQHEGEIVRFAIPANV